MVVFLRDVLVHPLILSGDPVLLSGEDGLDRMVRWVHSADLYDIAPLLRGDEVLLTNGVGLLSVSEDARRTYVRLLAQKGVAALMFEVGRTFIDLPAEMIAEARRLRLPLVVLQPALRFTEVTEAINSMIIDGSIEKLRRADEISRSLSEILVRGGSLSEIIEGIRQMSGTWAMVRDNFEQTVASAGPLPDAPAASRSATAPIIVYGTFWGNLIIGLPDVPTVLLDALLERGPLAIALALIRNQPRAVGSLRLGHALIEQFLEGRPIEEHVLQEQLRASGLPVADHPYACVVVDRVKVKAPVDVLERVAHAHGPSIVGIYDDLAFAIISGPIRASSSSLIAAVCAELEDILRYQGIARAAVGPNADNLVALPRSMNEARLTLTLAQQQQQQLEHTVVTAKNLATERLLHKHIDQSELRRFIDEQLGRLLEHDARHHTSLLPTLDIFLRCGGSKAAAAEQLHLRRQSLYYRLRKISTILDVDLGQPGQRFGLFLAIKAMRVVGGFLTPLRIPISPA